MPYISRQRREAFRDFEKTAKATRFDNVGELTWGFYVLALQYLAEHGESFRTMSEVVGAAECSKLEFARRKLAPYEDMKRTENGDVYEVLRTEVKP